MENETYTVKTEWRLSFLGYILLLAMIWGGWYASLRMAAALEWSPGTAIFLLMAAWGLTMWWTSYFFRDVITPFLRKIGNGNLREELENAYSVIRKLQDDNENLRIQLMEAGINPYSYSPPPVEAVTKDDILNGWKEISEYLGIKRDGVISRNFPIHRNKKGGGVYALKSELSAHLKN